MSVDDQLIHPAELAVDQCFARKIEVRKSKIENRQSAFSLERR